MQSILDLERKFFRNADCKRAPEQDRIILAIPKDSPFNKLLEDSGQFKQIASPDPNDWKHKINMLFPDGEKSPLEKLVSEFGEPIDLNNLPEFAKQWFSKPILPVDHFPTEDEADDEIFGEDSPQNPWWDNPWLDKLMNDLEENPPDKDTG